MVQRVCLTHTKRRVPPDHCQHRKHHRGIASFTGHLAYRRVHPKTVVGGVTAAGGAGPAPEKAQDASANGGIASASGEAGAGAERAGEAAGTGGEVGGRGAAVGEVAVTVEVHVVVRAARGGARRNSARTP